MTCRDLTASESVTFDFTELLDRVGGDHALAKEIASIFIEEAPCLVKTIRSAMDAADAVLLERSAHSLKGAAANFGAHGVIRSAFQLEQLGRQRRLDGADQALERLEDELSRLLPALTGIV